MAGSLKPCPFCGAGETRVDVHTMWTGMRSIPTHVTIRHWCPQDRETSGGAWTPTFSFTGKTQEQAEALWNRRQ